jgi:hypothetical protein
MICRGLDLDKIHSVRLPSSTMQSEPIRALLLLRSELPNGRAHSELALSSLLRTENVYPQWAHAERCQNDGSLKGYGLHNSRNGSIWPQCSISVGRISRLLQPRFLRVIDQDWKRVELSRPCQPSTRRWWICQESITSHISV